MNTLETCYHHARCFNHAIPLRAQLKEENFMRFPRYGPTDPVRMPHLLEQEVSSIVALANFSMQTYKYIASSTGVSVNGGDHSNSHVQMLRRPSHDEEELTMVVQERLQSSVESIVVRFLQLDAIFSRDKDMERDRASNGTSVGASTSFTNEQREGYRSA